MTPNPFRPSRRELIRWAAATSILSGIPLGCGGSSPLPVEPWKPGFLTADEVASLEALADTVVPPDASGAGGGKALGAVVFVDRLLTALDGASPKLHAEGPYSGRAPLPDGRGGATATFPADDFKTFAPLDRVNALAWKLKLFGSASVEGGAPNEALLGAVTGLRDEVRALLANTRKLAADLGSKPLAERLRLFNQLEETDRDLAIELICQAAWSAPEYGGNASTAGWKQIHFEGDSQPLGYSLWDEVKGGYRERPDAPMSTANPGADPEALDQTSRDLIETVVNALGGRIAS